MHTIEYNSLFFACSPTIIASIFLGISNNELADKELRSALRVPLIIKNSCEFPRCPFEITGTDVLHNFNSSCRLQTCLSPKKLVALSHKWIKPVSYCAPRVGKFETGRAFFELHASSLVRTS